MTPSQAALADVVHVLANAVCMAMIVALLVPVAVVVYNLMCRR